MAATTQVGCCDEEDPPRKAPVPPVNRKMDKSENKAHSEKTELLPQPSQQIPEHLKLRSKWPLSSVTL